MNLYDVMFMVGFFSCIGITLRKMYNAFTAFTAYDLKMGFLLFISFLLSWGITFFVTIISFSELLFIQFFALVKLFLVLQIMFLLFEIIQHIRTKVTDKVVPYNSVEARKAAK